MTSQSIEMDRILSAAQARMDAGEPACRHIPLAYTPPPGDSSLGNLPWMTEEESDRLAILRRLAVQNDGAEAAQIRIRAKVMLRKTRNLYTSDATCIETAGEST